MELQQQAQWLRGFLDSLSHSDSISKRQIEILQNKLEQLIVSVEESEPNDYYEEPVVKTSKIAKTYISSNVESPDDLPF